MMSSQSTGTMMRRTTVPAAPAAPPIVTPMEDEHNLWDAWQHQTRTLAHYERYEQIGQGTYGQVYRARCKDTGRFVAMKKMRLHHSGSGMPLQLIREIKILKRLQHPNLLCMVEVVTSKGVEYLDEDDDPPPKDRDRVADARESYKGNLFLVLEYVSHDLTGLLDVNYPFSQVQIKCIFRQLLQALAYMHACKYVHRDIKSSNILLDDHFQLKLADFGLARSLEPPILDQVHDKHNALELTNKVITLWYRPPEILVGATQYTAAVDVWSAGCILAELLLGRPLVTGKTELEQFNLILDLLGTPSKDTWDYLCSLKKQKGTEMPQLNFDKPKPSKLRSRYGSKLPGPAMNLLEKMLEWDPRKRMTAANALESRYFWSQPQAPEHPYELGVIEGHFHEFQTKKKRRQAKAIAEERRAHAKFQGATEEQAQQAFDETYRRLMKRVAEEGFDVVFEEEVKPKEVPPEESAANLTPPEQIEERRKRQEMKKLEGEQRRDERRDGVDRRLDRKHSRERDDEDEERRKRQKRERHDESDRDRKRSSSRPGEDKRPARPVEDKRPARPVEDKRPARPVEDKRPDDRYRRDDLNYGKEAMMRDRPLEGRPRDFDGDRSRQDAMSERPRGMERPDWREEPMDVRDRRPLEGRSRDFDADRARRDVMDERPRGMDRPDWRGEPVDDRQGRPRGFEGDWRREPMIRDQPFEGRPRDNQGDRRRERDFPGEWQRDGRPGDGEEGRYRRPMPEDRARDNVDDRRRRDRDLQVQERMHDGRSRDEEARRERVPIDERPRDGRSSRDNEARREGDRSTHDLRESSGHHRRRKSKKEKRRDKRKGKGDRDHHGRDDRRERDRGPRHDRERSRDRGRSEKEASRGGNRERDRFQDDRSGPSAHYGGPGPYGPPPPRETSRRDGPPPPGRRDGPPPGRRDGPPPPSDGFGHYGPGGDNERHAFRDDRGPRNRGRR